MRGDVLIGPQVPAGYRACLRQFAEQQHQHAQPGPGEKPADTKMAASFVPRRCQARVRRGRLAAGAGMTGRGHELVVLLTARFVYFYKTVEDNAILPQGEQSMN